VIFGGLAVIVIEMTLDPWLCVAGFGRFCLYRMLYCIFEITLLSLGQDFDSACDNFSPFYLSGFLRGGLFWMSLFCVFTIPILWQNAYKERVKSIQKK